MTHWLHQRFGIEHPIIQAPMAGVSSPAMAAAVCNAGGMGSLGVGAMTADAARDAIHETRALTQKPFNINVFCHGVVARDAEVEAAWIEAMAPMFQRFEVSPPDALSEIYQSFLTNNAMQEMLVHEAPAVVSFHFGLPPVSVISALKQAGVTLFASATSLDEARACQAAGIDAVVAQGIEAGGHRGIFDPAGPDAQLSTGDLVQQLVTKIDLPIVAAGGIMTGADIAQMLSLGASAAQLGTAFIACDESLADPAYRAALRAPASHPATLTPAVSGRPARCLRNRFIDWSEHTEASIPAYPVAYDAAKALGAAAKSAGESGYGAQWSGAGGLQATDGSTGEIMARLVVEMLQA
ncbi:nitronate monooxygenase [uncultured Shimia sp.]|uniref:NAD(P)H-dependent flavin oxidoreductase n=1 Tax=uncultured Shimia sp. TaxID=573152 RepID=UPI00261EE1F8|nr:nitronate monooxygenase [uncultured Shimia sp.]